MPLKPYVWPHTLYNNYERIINRLLVIGQRRPNDADLSDLEEEVFSKVLAASSGLSEAQMRLEARRIVYGARDSYGPAPADQLVLNNLDQCLSELGSNFKLKLSEPQKEMLRQISIRLERKPIPIELVATLTPQFWGDLASPEALGLTRLQQIRCAIRHWRKLASGSISSEDAKFLNEMLQPNTMAW